MKPLYTEETYNNAKSMVKLPCECEYCKSTFYTTKRLITQELKENRGRVKYCSQICLHKHKEIRNIVTCKHCGNVFEKKVNQIKITKNNFCSRSCAAYYNNKHKKYGFSRSKLERWLEEQLLILYPNLNIHFNRKDTIMSEIDIYIPSLNLAFELNGIVHYEPIYGVDKLQYIQNNDVSKTKACHDAKIDLCVIDVSAQKYVKPSTSQKYLDIIANIINNRK